MKFFANTLLISLFVPLVLIGLLSATIKFQILNFNFWQTTLAANNVYTKLSQTLQTYEENQIVKEGGKKSDAKILTDLITPQIFKIWSIKI